MLLRQLCDCLLSGLSPCIPAGSSSAEVWTINVMLLLRALSQVTADMVRNFHGEYTESSSSQRTAFQRHLRLRKGKQRAPNVKRGISQLCVLTGKHLCTKFQKRRIAFDIPLLRYVMKIDHLSLNLSRSLTIPR